MAHHFIILQLNPFDHRVYREGQLSEHSVSQLQVCFSAEGAKNLSWPWLTRLHGWGSLTMAFTDKCVCVCVCVYIYIYIYIYIFIYLDVFGQVKRKKSSFLNTEISKPLPVSVHSVLQVRFKFRSQLLLLPQIRWLITFWVVSSIIKITVM